MLRADIGFSLWNKGFLTGAPYSHKSRFLCHRATTSFKLAFLVLLPRGTVNSIVEEYITGLIGQLIDRRSRGLGSALSCLGLAPATRPTEDVY